MNNLTNDMTRLCGEIAALRDSRAAVISNLAETREEMQAGVSRMLAGFGEARAEMAEQTKGGLREFVLQLKGPVNDLRQKVADLLEGFRDDLAGAHRAWYGARPAPRKVRVVAEPIAKAMEPPSELPPKARKKKQ